MRTRSLRSDRERVWLVSAFAAISTLKQWLLQSTTSAPHASSETNERGFTVLEVVVALAILSLSLAALFGSLAESTWNMTNAEELARGGMLAQSLLDRVGTEMPLRVEDIAGETADGFHWQIRISNYTSPAAPGPGSVGAYSVVAEVRWNTLKPQSVVFTTLRLGPARAQP